MALAVVIAAPTAASAINNKGRLAWVSSYIAKHQEDDGRFPSTFGTAHAATADAVISFVASGQGGDQVEDAVDWLETNISGIDNAGKRAKAVLAVVAAGRDPRDFGGRDLVGEIEATLQEEGTYLSDPWSQVYDQALSLLALDAADATIPRRSLKWLGAAQCPSGGWQFDQPRQAGENWQCRNVDDPNDFSEADTNTTGLVLQAFAAVPRSVGLDKDPFEWLRKRRDRVKGGWGFDRTFSLTDSASTSIVIQAYAAHGRTAPKAARKALRALQRYCTVDGAGGFSRGWVEKRSGKIRKVPGEDLGNSVAAVLGLLAEPLPVKPVPFLKPLSVPPPCNS